MDPDEDPVDRTRTWTRTRTPELLVIGPDWMEVGALVESGPEVEVL